MLFNRLAVPLRTLQKLTKAHRWHHTSLTCISFFPPYILSNVSLWSRLFLGFHSVQDLILPVLQSMSHSQSGPLNILDMGCGTSTLGPCIYKTSPYAVRVTYADISSVAVKLLEKHANFTSVQHLDCTQLRGYFGARSLDLILDKGTDALVRSKEGQVKAGQIVKQCLQVLKPSGSLLQFSDEDPDLGELRGVRYFCYQISPCA
uniref:Methyltransferase domain-containing protein n=1 Tax=Sinocyclocheilus rhinocerous TaxID=307959 RepID=A0A673J3G2_9TELE